MKSYNPPLPALVGTEKQIAFAGLLRQNFLATALYALEGPPGLDRDAALDIAIWLCDETNAGAVIDKVKPHQHWKQHLTRNRGQNAIAVKNENGALSCPLCFSEELHVTAQSPDRQVFVCRGCSASVATKPMVKAWDKHKFSGV